MAHFRVWGNALHSLKICSLVAPTKKKRQTQAQRSHRDDLRERPVESCSYPTNNSLVRCLFVDFAIVMMT